PVGYGMKFAARFAGAAMLPLDFNPGDVNATAYAARQTGGKVLIAILNKDASKDLKISVPSAEVIEVMSGRSLDQPETRISHGAHGVKVAKAGNGHTVVVPAHTAVMLQLR
ncbi:MAG TPA: hypothetical protein VHN81_02055, partial [Edaphobacter sp.]|nr:hypothetical protein [Edaphobacter sp.]